MRTVLLILSILTATASADPDTLRLKMRPSSGELVATSARCGKETEAAVWKLVARAPYVEITTDTMVAAVGDARRAADRVVAGAAIVGFYDQSDTKTIVLTVRRSQRKGRSMPLELSIIMRAGGERSETCAEKWVGLAEVL